MKRKDRLSTLLGVIILIAVLITKHQESKVTNEINQHYSDAIGQLGDLKKQNKLQSGYVVSGAKKLHQYEIQRTLRLLDKQDLPRLWNVDTETEYAKAYSAMGIDKKHHFANSYLIGYTPFKTEEYWVPLYMLASRKLYQYDHLQYSGLEDVWQNSLQAFKNTRGDCEDHAVALADWLIGLGLDARVALGTYKQEGHAWVIVFKDGKEYLLEATRKSRINQWSKYRLAKVEHEYHPEFLFNRDNLWINTGSKYTVSYTGNNWKLASTFYKATS